VYKAYIGKRYCFSLVCTYRKAIKNFEVDVYVPKGPPNVEILFTMHVMVSSNLCFSSKWCVV
jgi:hypothetical protein